MATYPFYILDVFAEEQYAGNPLAVVRGASDLAGETMQKIAKEMNYSETTFILSDAPRGGGYDVRIFTPEEELPFAGHPTLGTAFVIMREVLARPLRRVSLNLKVGQIPVTAGDDGVLWMRQVRPSFGREYHPEKVVEVVGLSPDDVDERLPVQEVSTGLPFVMIPLKANGALRRARRDKAAFERFAAWSGARMVFLFSAEPRDRAHHLAARMFSVYDSIPEDPATGSANGCLAGYLVKHRCLGDGPIDVMVEQGYEIGRPSLLYLRACERQDGIDVRVGGKVIMVARGRLL